MKPAEVQGGPETVVDMRGGIADALPDCVREKVAAALVRTSRPVLRVHVRVRHDDPARGDGVTAHGNVDLLVERLRHRLERLPRDRRPRRGHDHGEALGAGEPEIETSPPPTSGSAPGW